MSVSKSEVESVFLEARTVRELKSILQERYRFNLNEEGCNKWVFIRDDLKWVVKIVHGRNNHPRKTSIAYQFYLKPTETCVRYLKDGHYQDRYRCRLTFQPKVKTGSLRALKIIVNKLEKYCEDWTDAHEGNVGFYKGKPVIIDY